MFILYIFGGGGEGVSKLTGREDIVSYSYCVFFIPKSTCILFSMSLVVGRKHIFSSLLLLKTHFKCEDPA
jgi:hypothetical protein